MKKVLSTRLSFFFTSLLTLNLVLFTSCGGIRNMQVQVMRPARITVPQEIQSIGVLNRSIPTNLSAIEGTLTGETPRQDKKLSEECLQGLVETLNTSSRFTVAKCEEQMNSSDESSLSFGSPLSWESVDSLCDKYKVDGLLVLEFFDTDYLIANPISTARQVVGAVMNGGSGAQVEVRGTATANAGYRVYARKSRSILYEDRFQHRRYWVQRSINPVEAIAKLIKRNEALMVVSKETGYEFAMNIVPLYFWENRDLYKGSKGDLERGERQALAKDWDGAIQSWERVYNQSPKSKHRAKAAFNIALGYEVKGDLNLAQSWVQKAYVEGGKKAALNYANILDQRVREQARLNEQNGQN